MMTAECWIEKLQLIAHPEGGYYKEVYRNTTAVESGAGTRSLATSIYFLLHGSDVSHFHALASDELWYFHAGTSSTVHLIDPSGNYSSQCLGSNPDLGESLQILLPAGTLFGAEVNDPSSYTLMGCMVAPGFDFEDFTLFKRNELLARFPQHATILEKLTLP